MSKTRRGVTPLPMVEGLSRARGAAARSVWWILLGEHDSARASLGRLNVEERAEIAEAARALAEMAEEDYGR